MYKPAYYHWTDQTLAAKRQHAEIARLTGVGIGRVLEIGSGDGSWLHHFQEKGWECLGVEDDEQQFARSMERQVLCLQAPLSEVNLPRNSYDLVRVHGFFGGDMELDAALAKIVESIHSTGYLILDAWNASGWPMRPSFDAPPQSIKRNDLLASLERAGLSVGGIIAPGVGDEIWAPLKSDAPSRPSWLFRMMDGLLSFFDNGSLLVAFAQKPPRS